MSEIAAASREQGSGIAQVNDAVAQMDEVTQQNAALVEQAAAGCLQDQTVKLVQALTVFKLDRKRQPTANRGLSEHKPPLRALPNRSGYSI